MTVESRLDELEEELAALNKSIAKRDLEVRQQLRTTRVNASQQAQAISQQLSSVGEQVENLAAGGSVTELIGVVWVAIGILLSSLPEELAALW